MMSHQLPSNWKRPFFSIWIGQAVSLAGSQIVQFALVWWLTQRTGSATVLATASMVALLPQIVLGPLVGAYVDRWNRRIVMIVADAAVALSSVWLLALFWTGAIEVWHVYVAMFIRAVGGSFHWPAMQASTTLMVPREHLARIAGLNQTLNGVLNIASPPLGALLMELLPLHGVIAVDVVTATLAILPLLFIAIPQPPRSQMLPAGASPPSIWEDVRVGIRYVWGWPGMMALVALAMVLKIALQPAFSLLPLLVSQHFQGNAAALSLMEAIAGIGIVIGGLGLSAWGGFKRKIFTTMLGLLMLSGGFLILGVIPGTAFAVALVSVFIVGFSIPLIDGPLMAIMQSTVAPDLQGRVFMLLGSLTSLTAPIGLAIVGPVSDWIGLQVWYIAAALMCGVLAVVGYMTPALVNIEDNASNKSPAALQPPPAAAPIDT